MSPLNIHPEEVAPVSKKKKSKTLKVMLGLAALVLIPVIGTTFAATIGINGGGANTVQFAQGSIATAGCDAAMTVSATSAYLSGAFKLGTITVSGIDLTSGCEGKTLVVSVDVGSAEANIIGTTKQISFTIPSVATSTATLLTGITTGFTAVMTNASGAPYETATPIAYDEAAKIVIGFTTPADSLIASDTVLKFLIQSS
jgi:hypothetical protein